MPWKRELRFGAPEHRAGLGSGASEPLVQSKSLRQLAGISGTSSDAVMSSHRKTDFDSVCLS